MDSILSIPAVGTLIEGEGIYTGWIRLGDGRPYAVLTAPEDLKTTAVPSSYEMSFREAVYEITGLENWHGHPGAILDYAYQPYGSGRGNQVFQQLAIYDEGREDRHVDGWYIPSASFLKGGLHIHGYADVVGLCESRNIGAFAGTFEPDISGGKALYMSSSIRSGRTGAEEECSRLADIFTAEVLATDFSKGSAQRLQNVPGNGVAARCRPQRLLPIQL